MNRRKYTLISDGAQSDKVYNGGITSIVATKSKELCAVDELKARVKDVLLPVHDDYYMTKWLKARNFDVDKAEEMFRASMAYREKMNVTSLLANYQPPEVLQVYLPGGFCGFDREGSPVLIELYGYTDMKGILYSTKTADIERTKLLLGEQVNKMLEEQTIKLGKQVEGMIVIIDMDNVGTSMLWGPGIQMYAHMGKILQDNYPEIVKKTFIVNAPRIFPMLWKLFRPLVTEEMKQKVSICGADFRDELLQHVPSEQLPAFLGGTLTDADGNVRCTDKICQGGVVPEHYYLKDRLDLTQFKLATVVPGDQKEISVTVSQIGAILRWEFLTDGYDVGFGVFYDGGDGRETIEDPRRVNSHLAPEDGTHTCTHTGQYILTFDNSYSWARAKTLYYNVDVLAPDDSNSISRDLETITHGLDKTAIEGGEWTSLVDEDVVTKC